MAHLRSVRQLTCRVAMSSHLVIVLFLVLSSICCVAGQQRAGIDLNNLNGPPRYNKKKPQFLRFLVIGGDVMFDCGKRVSSICTICGLICGLILISHRFHIDLSKSCL